MKNEKIELLTLDFPPIIGGISHYLFEIFSHFPPDKVRIIGVSAPQSESFDSRQKFEICRLKVPTKPESFQKQLKFFSPFYFSKVAQHDDISFVLCGQAHYSILLPAWIISRVRHVPYGVFTYGLDLLQPQLRSYRALFNALIRNANLIFVISRASQNIVEQLDVNQEKIQIVYPSVNGDSLKSNITSQDVKNRYRLAGKKCILTVGRLVERKGHDKVIQALPLILQKVPNAHYLIVGSGPNETFLKQLVKESAMDDHVTFTGYVPQEELGAYLSSCDVFAMISRSIPEKGDVEGFGIVYLQANLFGKPVVAGLSGGVPEAVIDQKTGLLVNPLDEKAIADAITELLVDVHLAKSLGSFGRTRVLTEFNSEVSAQKVKKSIDLICSS